MTNEIWRDCSPTRREEFLQWLNHLHTQRSRLGVERYGTTFIGDPLSHLLEEWLDMGFYLWVTLRKEGRL